LPHNLSTLIVSRPAASTLPALPSAYESARKARGRVHKVARRSRTAQHPTGWAACPTARGKVVGTEREETRKERTASGEIVLGLDPTRQPPPPPKHKQSDPHTTQRRRAERARRGDGRTGQQHPIIRQSRCCWPVFLLSKEFALSLISTPLRVRHTNPEGPLLLPDLRPP
jgi:hypothetical protein